MQALTHERHRRYEHQDLWDKFWKDKDGNYVIYQRPNAFLITWLVLTVASLFAPRGVLESVFWWASLAVLAVWAVLEVVSGVNYFRRCLGAVVMILIVLAAFKLA